MGLKILSFLIMLTIVRIFHKAPVVSSDDSQSTEVWNFCGRGRGDARAHISVSDVFELLGEGDVCKMLGEGVAS